MAASPRVLRAMTCRVTLPRTNHGSGATVYVSANLPTPTFESDIAYPPMRASTLATFELVSTLPETRSPARTVVSLIAIARICGGASGATRGAGFARRGAAAVVAWPDGAGVGVITGAVAAAVGDGVGAADAWGAGVGCAVIPGDGDGFVARVPRLQFASAITAAAMHAAERAVRMVLRFSPFDFAPPPFDCAAARRAQDDMANVLKA